MIEHLLERKLAGFAARDVLDVGPGYASFGRVAARVTGAKAITYLDCDPSVLAWQAAECQKASLDARPLATNLDAADLSRIDGQYDLVLCQEVLEHLSNAEEVLTSLARLLSPGGRMVITVPTQRSERWLRRINPSYMTEGAHGHVREFDEPALRKAIVGAGLSVIEFIPTQPHYFIYHTWLFGTRMKVEGSTGRILTTSGLRSRIANRLLRSSRRFFTRTGFERWGRVFSRNYFVIAEKPAG